MGARDLTERSVLAMRSPVNWAVLGLLIERAGYGYDLFQRFERTYAEDLQLSTPSQIYGALQALVRRELIEQLTSEDAGAEAERQPKPRYQATDQGKSEYQHWLTAQVTEKRQLSPLFARQLAMLGPSAALVVLDRYEQALLAERRTAHSVRSLAGGSSLARRLVEEGKRLEAGEALKWIEYARRELEVALAAQDSER